MSEMIGTVVRVVGPIIDVRFAEGGLPGLCSAWCRCMRVGAGCVRKRFPIPTANGCAASRWARARA